MYRGMWFVIPQSTLWHHKPHTGNMKTCTMLQIEVAKIEVAKKAPEKKWHNAC